MRADEPGPSRHNHPPDALHAPKDTSPSL
jgi:hypothetical protein